MFILRCRIVQIHCNLMDTCNLALTVGFRGDALSQLPEGDKEDFVDEGRILI